MKSKVLFLCTGNSCRSQMAEALTNSLFAGRWQAVSAGTKPEKVIHPLAVQALEEINIRHRGNPKLADVLKNHHLDLVVTVCADAGQNCPVWLGEELIRHHSFMDPAKITGT